MATARRSRSSGGEGVDEQSDAAHVEDGVLHGYLRREHGAGLGRGHGHVGHEEDCAEALRYGDGRGDEAVSVVDDDLAPPVERGGGVVGVSLDPRGDGEDLRASSKGRPSSSLAATMPATAAAELLPSPRPRGISLVQVKRTSGAGCPASSQASRKDRATRLSGPVGSSSRPRPRISKPVAPVSTHTVFQMSRAMPRQSNPGPMLALVAGACTVTLRAMPSLPAVVRSRRPLYTPPYPESDIIEWLNT